MKLLYYNTAINDVQMFLFDSLVVIEMTRHILHSDANCFLCRS